MRMFRLPRLSSVHFGLFLLTLFTFTRLSFAICAPGTICDAGAQQQTTGSGDAAIYTPGINNQGGPAPQGALKTDCHLSMGSLCGDTGCQCPRPLICSARGGIKTCQDIISDPLDSFHWR